MSQQTQEIRLRVVEALQDDAYKGIARIESEVMRVLGVKRGDVVAITGGRTTVAIIDRAYPADVGEGIIRVDGIIRRNCKAGIGDLVILGKIDVKEAKKIIIAPAMQGIMVQTNNPEAFKQGLLGRAVVKADIVVLGGTQRRRDLMSEDLDMNDIFGDLDKIFGSAFGNLGFGGPQQMRFIV